MQSTHVEPALRATQRCVRQAPPATASEEKKWGKNGLQRSLYDLLAVCSLDCLCAGIVFGSLIPIERSVPRV